jgi:rhomboid protease GluP
MSIQTCVSCGRQFDRAIDGPGAPQTCAVCALTPAQTASVRRRAPVPTVPASAFPVTLAIVGLNVLVYAFMVFRGVSFNWPTPLDVLRFGGDTASFTFAGQWWRLVTSMFVHYGLLHIAMNMWCLWNLGRAAERLLGRSAYVLAYMVSGIFGSINSIYWHPRAVGAGASGAIFGLAGVLVSFVYLKKTPAHLQIGRSILSSLGMFIIFNLAFGAAIPGISNAAHIGGLLMGLAVGALLPSASASESSRRARLSLVVTVSAVVLVASALYAKSVKAGGNEGTSNRLSPKLSQPRETAAHLRG